jgi:hypothetical protein
MNKINWTTEEVDVSKLKGYKNNPRDITESNLELLKESVETYGQVVPLVVNQDYTVLGGNQRIKIMQGKVKVQVPDRMLTAQEESELVIILNNKLGEWDFNKIEAMGFDKEVLIQDFGFDPEYIAKQEMSLDDFDFELDDGFTDNNAGEDKLVKQFVVKFEGITPEELTAEIEHAFVKSNVQSLEDLIKVKAQKYETITA